MVMLHLVPVLSFIKLVERLVAAVDSRCKDHEPARVSGVIINTCGWVDGAGYNLLVHAAQAFSVNAILVLGHDRLCSDLKVDKKLANIAISKLSKSGGVVTRDANFRKRTRNKMVKQYFYGSNNDLHPHTKVLNFKDIFIYRVGGGPKAPTTALPIGTKRLIDPNQLVRVTPDSQLVHNLLGVSYAKDEGSLLKENIAGFIYVNAVDVQKQKLTVLAPSPGPLPSNYLLTGTLKWFDD